MPRGCSRRTCSSLCAEITLNVHGIGWGTENGPRPKQHQGRRLRISDTALIERKRGGPVRSARPLPEDLTVTGALNGLHGGGQRSKGGSLYFFE